jgi:glycine cleavage system H protein
METPKNLLYTIEHEWIRIEGNKGFVGVTSFAQDQLGDVVFVELPEAGRKLEQDEAFGVIESVKTVSDLYSPVSATVKAVNKELETRPELVNSDPYGEGWIIELELTGTEKTDHLLSPEKYQEQCSNEAN